MFNYSYLCGANVSIFVDTKNLTNVKIKDHILDMINQKVEPLDAAAVHYTLNNSVQPIYSHHANKFDAIVSGREIVQGSIVLNYKDLTYFYQKINPELYVQHLLSNKAFNDKKYFSNYVDYNYLPPFNIYIVENGSIEKRSIRIHVLNNCYVSSRGQSIYADDQSIIEEYSFISQFYTFADFYNVQISAVESTVVEKSSTTTVQDFPNPPKVEEKPAKKETKVAGVSEEKEEEAPVNTNGPGPEIKPAITEEEIDKALKTVGEITDMSEAIENNSGTATTPLPENTKQEQPQEKKKSSDLIIQDPRMKDDIRNFDKVLGANPEATFVLMNNVILPKYGLKSGGTLSSKIVEDEIGDNTPSGYIQYTQEHFNEVLNFANNKNKDKQSITNLINKTEYQIPASYSTSGIVNAIAGEGNLPLSIPTTQNLQTSYLEMLLNNYQVDTTGWTYDNYRQNRQDDKRLFKKSMEYSQYLANIYRTENSGRFPRGVLFDVPSGDTNTLEEKGILNQQKMDYANIYKGISERWRDPNNTYTYHNDYWLNETLMPNSLAREVSDWYIYNNQKQLIMPNYQLQDGSFSYDSYGNNLWNQQVGYYSDAPNYNPSFFQDSTFQFLNTFFNAQKPIDPIYAIYGIMSDYSDAPPGEKQSNLEQVSNLINHINNTYVKGKPNQDVLRSLLELSKQIYYYGPNGEPTTLYDSWVNSTNTRSSRWSVR